MNSCLQVSIKPPSFDELLDRLVADARNMVAAVAPHVDERRATRFQSCLRGYLFNPTLTIDDLAAAGIRHIDDLDFAKRGVAILEVQRRAKNPLLGAFAIGGLAQLTTVTPDGVSSSVIHRWPNDHVGHMIEP